MLGPGRAVPVALRTGVAGLWVPAGGGGVRGRLGGVGTGLVFALLWGASLLVFTWYTMKDTDMTGQPAMMKNMQYFTPIIFTVMFNSYAAGLSLYMLFSNVLNIAQTVVTKNYVIDNEKIRGQLMENKKKPKKVSAFRQKLNEAMQQQEAVKAQQAKKK